PRALKVGARRLAANAGRLFDAAERPAEPPQRQNLLSLVVSQDVGHADGTAWARPSRQRLGAVLSHWPVFRCPRLAGFGCPRRTGGEALKVKRLYADVFSIMPTFKLWVGTNHKPIIRGTDRAIWRRICLIPFTVSIPDWEQDRMLMEKLRAE